MGFSTRRGGGVGPAGSRLPGPKAMGGEGVMGELNITPMIDVMLALLIIFIVVTPVLTEYSATPPAATWVTAQTLRDAVTLGIDAQGTYFLEGDSLPPAELPARLRAIYAARPGDHLLYLRADRALPYRVVLDAIDAARAAGVRTVGAISQPRGLAADSAAAGASR
ncbi:MAG TPA: biopolymer transporter ExbD [Gemmatimonadales bacterium]|nr:biopolymer transporter ExbD [Gemmatimonadales bacterium]